MRRLLCWAISLIIILGLVGCGGSVKQPEPTPTPTPKPTATPKTEPTADEIENEVVIALYGTIQAREPLADPDSCRYSINKTEVDGSGSYYHINVYGTVTLYDKYGNTIKDARRNFTVKILYNSGILILDSCELKR